MVLFYQVFILGFATCAGTRIYKSVHEGSSVLLPCDWKNITRAQSSHRPHIEWRTIDETVFERRGEEAFQGEGYENRVDVPKDNLLSGDCSLKLNNVKQSDAGLYESFLLVGRTKRSLGSKWVFIQSVELSVDDKIEEMKKSEIAATQTIEKNDILMQEAPSNTGVIHTPTQILAFTFLLHILLCII